MVFILDKCSKCVKRTKGTYDYCLFCCEHDYCSFDHDEMTPIYSYTVAKQLIFDCIMELECGRKEINNEEIATKLQGVLKELDKMKAIE